MKIKMERTYGCLFPCAIFIVLNIPSIKIIHSSEIINMAAISLVWGVGLLRVIFRRKSQLKLSKYRLIFLFLFSCMWMVLLLFTIFHNSPGFSMRNLFQFTVTYLLVVGALIFVEKKDLKQVLYLQVLWSTALSIGNYFELISLERDLGQHYLTLGMPIAAGLIVTICLIIFMHNHLKSRLLFLILLLIQLIGVTSLNGRAPVLLSIIVPSILLILTLMVERNITKKVKLLFAILIVIPMLVLIIFNNLSETLTRRLEGGIQDEDRSRLLNDALNLFTDNILGYGINGTVNVGIDYPHNIFLEVALAGGIIALLFFILLCLFVLQALFKSVKLKSYYIGIGALATFFFLTWNISFNLSAAYVPFTALAVLIVVNEDDWPIVNKKVS
ncbi:O-antigen ligase family protein [Salipaludibacillus agaradhaerens]|jgi:O-antigen ligase|uniref:O-antigen ligase family protein n=1 Tax=Salipaludibacillus agaradhaerens TaxID=76935 RepID=UPI002150A440|nr:O-antigen ligase family protein [Salipaludibacillus agaradhaerens]MCR6108132.1 O-antigen ligase family protein [Salipaludibacillus agaradhaerens]MCR6120157.1 O-antigen ligase family protein [Salipaludibacillus agaradhaerens]